MVRAVVDTNILVSALLRPGSSPDAVVQGVVTRTLTPVLCDAILEEYAVVLARPRFAFSAALVQELLHLLRQQADWVSLPLMTAILRFPIARTCRSSAVPLRLGVRWSRAT